MRKSAPLFCALLLSLSARRAWIEISAIAVPPSVYFPSLSARRAWIEMIFVDDCAGCALVALRKESVDRNIEYIHNAEEFRKSLSARRAWIEIIWTRKAPKPTAVALRKESVDRNIPGRRFRRFLAASLSARRAWIEISMSLQKVARASGRSPQGERG